MLRDLGRPAARAGALLALAALSLLAVAACGGDASGLRGRIEIDGSSTVFPIVEAAAEEFSLLHRGVQVTAGVSGTGGGFKRFCAGETDISSASRPIKPSEEEACAAAGIEFVETPVAFDGLTVAVNPENDWVDLLTVAELARIFSPDDPARRWSDVRGGWPGDEIIVFSPGADSGTFDYFTETVNGEAGRQRSEGVTFSEDDNVLVIGVEGERDGVGYFGFAYYANNADRLRAVPIDGGAGPVLPSPETIRNGAYAPLSRPLFLYVRVAALERAEVRAFLEFLLTEGRALVDAPEIGYVQLPASVYAAVLERVRARVPGSAINRAPAETPLLEVYGG